MRTVRQALADVESLVAGPIPTLAFRDELRAILADVEPEPEPAPAGGTIDRDALTHALLDGRAPADAFMLRDKILALVRPVESVVLGLDEASRVLIWKRAYDHRYGSKIADDALHARLGQAS